MKSLLKHRKSYNHIMLAAFPKSASTFLMRMLSEALGYNIRIFINSNDGSEQELYYPKLLEYKSENTVTHQHVRATPSNTKYLREFNFNTFVLIRDLEECVFSLRRHIYTQPNNWSIAHIKDDFFLLTEVEQLNFIVELCIPWYINFYVYWFKAIENKEIDAEFISFSQIVNETDITLNRILERIGKNKLSNKDIENLYNQVKDKSRITAVMDKEFPQTIFKLNEEQRKRLKKYKSYYPSVDFSPIGI